MINQKAGAPLDQVDHLLVTHHRQCRAPLASAKPDMLVDILPGNVVRTMDHDAPPLCLVVDAVIETLQHQ